MFVTLLYTNPDIQYMRIFFNEELFGAIRW